LGGAGRTPDAGDALAADGVTIAGGALGAAGVFGPNRAADAGPQMRAKAAIREIRANMKEAEQSQRERFARIYLAG
jgi:hypothetical protein